MSFLNALPRIRIMDYYLIVMENAIYRLKEIRTKSASKSKNVQKENWSVLANFSKGKLIGKNTYTTRT